MKWTGAAVWDAAIVLSLFLADNSHLVKGKRVLEVGAGLALASVAVAMAGASEVIATDYDEIVLGLARTNLEENVRLCNSCFTHTYT
jgi:predicted nicotinamide N-methyase